MLNALWEQKKDPDSATFSNFKDDDYSQGCGQIEEAFRALTKTISLNLIYQNIILDQLMMVMILDIITMFSIYDIRKN